MVKFNLNLEEQFLIEAIKERENDETDLILFLMERIGNEECLSLLRENEILSFGLGLEDHFQFSAFPEFEAEAWAITENTKSLLRILRLTCKVLSAHSIPVIALKNTGLAAAYDEIPAWAFPMGDIDLWIPKESMFLAHTALVEKGFVLKERFGDKGFDDQLADGGLEYSFEFEGKCYWVEIQWRPVAGKIIDQAQEQSFQLCLSRSKFLPDYGCHFLSPEDNLLQVCLHTAKHSYVRAPGFRLHTDVDRIVRRERIVWEVFFAGVERSNAFMSVYISLLLANILLDTPIPEWVLAKIKRKINKAKIISILLILKKVGLFFPKDKKFNRPLYGFFIYLHSRSLFDFISKIVGQIRKKNKSYFGVFKAIVEVIKSPRI